MRFILNTHNIGASCFTLTGAQYIIRLLELLGVKTLFAYPGGAVLPIYDALTNSKINDVLVRHEQGAAFAANGYARVSGDPGFCLATSGPGATNLVTGIADAYADSIPLIAMTGQVSSTLLGSDAFQETDITGICLPITKKTYLLRDVSEVEQVFMDAYKVVTSGRPGPVLIDIPKDVQNQEIELSSAKVLNFKKPVQNKLYNVSDKDLKVAVQLMRNATKPLVLAGHGVLLSKAWEEFRKFVQKENLPVVTTILGKGVLDKNDPLNFSFLGMHGMKYANLAVQNADLIIGFGLRFDDRITGKLNDFAPKAKILHVDIDKTENGKNVTTDLFLHADLKTFLEQVPNTRNGTNTVVRLQWLDFLTDLKSQYPIKEADYSNFDSVTAINILVELMEKDAVVTTDVGQHQMWASQYVDQILPNHFLTSGGLGTMGFGLPAAMGAQEACPDKEVWCITGDGSFQMNAQELMTCIQENWPVKILVLDNNYLGMVRQWQEQFYERNYSGVELLNPDFTTLAKAYGVKSQNVKNANELREAICQAKGYKGPYLIHAVVEKEENVFPMVAPGTSLSETIYYPDTSKKITRNEPNKFVAN